MIRKITFVILLLSFGFTGHAQQIAPAMEATFDRIIDSRFKPYEPGGAVLIAQKGKVLYECGFEIVKI